MRRLHGGIGVGALILMMTHGSAGDWPQFRGPEANGHAGGSRAPTTWGADRHVAWKAPVPGKAWSTPVIVGDRVFVSTAVPIQRHTTAKVDPASKTPSKAPADANAPVVFCRWEVDCLDRETGKVLWTTKLREQPPPIPTHPGNTYATESPASDGERVIAYITGLGLFCLDARTGKELWAKEFPAVPVAGNFGGGSSPALHAGKVFVQCDNEKQSFLAAFDVKTGRELWRVDREEKSSWASPHVWKNQVRTELVCLGGKVVRSYDPESGAVLWQMATGGADAFCASAASDEERIYFGVSAEKNGSPLWAINAGAAGDITLKDKETSNVGVAWKRARSAPGLSTPAVCQGRLYIVNGGVLVCYDAKTGLPAYEKQRLPNAKNATASPCAADGKVYVLDEEGQCFVIQAGPQYKLLGKNKLEDGTFWSSPAVAHDCLFLRGSGHLFCIRKS